MIKSEIVAHSLSPQGDELISVLCTFPRIILAEVNTHRMLSKNTSSSRAIPFDKMVNSVLNNPFFPIAWQKEHSGMQGTEYFEGAEGRHDWEVARDCAVNSARHLNEKSITKQLANRLLEPFMWTTMLITGSREGWDNFFHLRCPQYKVSQDHSFFKSQKDAKKELKGISGWEYKDFMKYNQGQAEIHMMALAEAIWDSVNESTPKQLKAGDWHIPFHGKINIDDVFQHVKSNNPSGTYEYPEYYYKYDEVMVKISTAMAARTSYTMVGEEKDFDLGKMISLHDRLVNQTPPHSSPLEHCAKAMTDDEHFEFRRGKLFEDTDTGLLMPADNDSAGWCFNLKGFISYRYIIDKQYK